MIYDKLCGSRYSATVFLTREARNLCKQFDNVIQFSQALAWLLSGVVPLEVLHYKKTLKQREQRFLKHAEYILSTINDKHVIDSVYESYRRSLEFGHLIYHYKEVYDRDRQARVRILTRKIWYEQKNL